MGRPATDERRPSTAKDGKAAQQADSGPAIRPAVAWISAAAVALAVLGIYVATLNPTVPTGDSGELISAAYVGGVAHPPGYPVYTMLGWVATHLWPGSPAVIMNFLSALFQAATVGLIGILTARLIDPEWPRPTDRDAGVAGLAAAVSLALSTAFWAYALVAEVFALNDLIAAGLLLLAIEWCRDRSKVWALWLLGLLSGLGAAHQQTIVLLGPGLALLLIAGVREDAARARGRKRKDRKPRLVKASHFVVGASLIVVGLLTYLWLPIAAANDPVVNFDDPETFDRFRNVVSRGPYGSFSLIPGGERGSIGENISLYGEYLIRSFTVVGVALAIAGSVWFWRNRRTEAQALTLAWFFAGPTFVVFAAVPLVDPITEGIVERFYILSSVVMAVAVGAGVYAVLEWLRGSRWDTRALSTAALAIVMVLAGTLAAFRWSHVDQSDNRIVETYGRDILSDLEPGSILLTRGDHNYTSLVYTQFVDGFRDDVVLLDLELLTLDSYLAEQRERHPQVVFPFSRYTRASDELAQFIAANDPQVPVYVTGPLAENEDETLREIRAGLVRRLSVDLGEDEYGLLLADRTLATDLRFPEGGYPAKSWEAVIARNYGNAAHSVGFAYHETEPTPDDAFVEEMYRLSIELNGPPQAYKNLGLFYWERDGDPAEIIELWEAYLATDPDDPQVDSIRTVIAQLRGG